jgi:hypothetical protein
MSQRFLDRGQLVGYDFDKKTLVVTMSTKTAEKMRADGWDVQTNDEVGNFLSITLGETTK